MGTSVLVIDDDEVFRGLVKRMLESAGLVVCGEAGTVEAARAAALELRPDALLVDVGLPDGNGADLAHELAALPWEPRVVLTSTDKDAAASACNSDGHSLVFVAKDDLPTVSLGRLLGAD